MEFLEGTTSSGKTTVGLVKFMLEVAASPKKLHMICGLDIGTVEKNILHKDLGICDIFRYYVRYRPAGAGGNTHPHIAFRTPAGMKIIYVLGYADKARWKKALGGQYGCAMVDEVNVADMDFVRELAMRCDYWLGTLNPDDPALPLYAEYVNKSRPLSKWAWRTPMELLQQLNAPPQPRWTHWYFSFHDNAGLTRAKRAQIERSAAPGTKLHRNKILGLRGRAEGLVFRLANENILTAAQAQALDYVHFACGVDTSYSTKSHDAFAFIFVGFTKDGRKVALKEKILNNAALAIPLSPSDVPERLVAFLDECRAEWGFARDVFIDCADQATVLECAKYKKTHPACLYRFLPSWKKLRVTDRLHLEAGWLAQHVSAIADACPGLLAEVNSYAWAEGKNEPLDGGDHAINAWQYAWMPHSGRIGKPWRG